MPSRSKIYRILFTSPWLLCIFTLIPALVILSVKLHANLPFSGTALLLANNACLALFSVFRLVRYLIVARRAIRYGSDGGSTRHADYVAGSSCETVRAKYQASGYTFTSDGGYGEKMDFGYLGTIIFYAGISLLLLVGLWDNFYQFSGTVLDGIGPSTNLNKVESYRSITKGPLASQPATLPLLRIENQHLPDSLFPRGATEVSLYSQDGKARTIQLIPGTMVRYGDYDIFMTKMVFEAEIVIKYRDAGVMFDQFVRLDPLVQKRGIFSFYGPYIGRDLVGGVYYCPEKSLFMVVVTRNGQRSVTDLQFQIDQAVVQGDYTISCAKLGQWSEIHVVKRRHKSLIFVGGIIALAGLILRLAVRPRRVWLKSTIDGCRLRSSGKTVVL